MDQVIIPLKTNMEPEKDSFPKESPFGPFLGSMLVFGGVTP